MEFYGYKKCSTCRNAHKYLAEAGVNIPFHDFVENPPSPEQLRSWMAKLGQGVQPFINVKGTRFKEMELKDKSLSEDEWVSLLTSDGKLLKRPVVVTDHTVVVGFAKDAYDKVTHRG